MSHGNVCPDDQDDQDKDNYAEVHAVFHAVV